MTEQMIKDQILNEVGEGRLTLTEAKAELDEAGITASDGYYRSLLAFHASAILEEAGFNRNGF